MNSINFLRLPHCPSHRNSSGGGAAIPSLAGCGQPLVTTGCGYLPTGYLPTGYFPTGYLPIGAAATGGGGSLRGKSAAPAALSAVNNPTMLNTAMNPAVLITARKAVVTSVMIFITLSPFVEALGRATEGRLYSPPAVERFPPLYFFDPSQNTTWRATKFLTKG